MALCYGSVARSILVYKNRSAQGSAQSLFLYAKLPGSLGWQSSFPFFCRSHKKSKKKTKISLAFATKIRALETLFFSTPERKARERVVARASRPIFLDQAPCSVLAAPTSFPTAGETGEHKGGVLFCGVLLFPKQKRLW